MNDDRKDAADIVRAVRRYLERERAAGGAQLLADGATRVGRSGAPAAAADGAVTRHAGARAPGGPGDAGGESKPAGSQGLAEAGFVSARAGRMPAPSGRQHPPARPEPPAIMSAITPPAPSGRQRPPAFPEPPAIMSAITPPAPEMFGGPTLAGIAEALHPAGLESRATLAAAALPVLAQVADEARACTKCGLCQTRTHAVPGVGTARGGIVFVGEAPGADEDRLGEPFVGRAGQLLDKIIKAMDEARLIPGLPLDRQHVYICNVLKCRPPENRNPLPNEIESCSPYLRRQLAAIQPRIICCLGKFAAELLVGVKGTIRDLRGKIYRYEGAKLIVTYHPAACLRSPTYKRPVWEDMQLLAREYLRD